jgi:hypothetical protein
VFWPIDGISQEGVEETEHGDSKNEQCNFWEQVVNVAVNVAEETNKTNQHE